ncbi:hypothetical protein D0B54_00155 [Solimonas sp. K1W22B-7]|uniref:hypothetical protein n=1 Tax=Solimonas sp. K1W22B-7 TaxID=2303331 RepID=UPI000E33438D|nr:hypothetical protein [Solimonas sp. K1W22B-7]AXQ27196.1 hypothetical protein D0B54_00155 [Solimonas sp. K1W22B-7]
MRFKNRAPRQQGMSLLSALLLGVVLLVGFFAVMQWHDASKKREQAMRVAVEEAKQLGLQMAEAQEKQRQQQADEQRVAADKQLQRQRKKEEFDKSMSALSSLHARWTDAERLAGSAARMDLVAAVEGLQAIKREAAAQAVSACLAPARDLLVSGMEKVIEGFMAIMQDAEAGKVLAQAKAAEGRTLLERYEREAGACPSP